MNIRDEDTKEGFNIKRALLRYQLLCIKALGRKRSISEH